MWLSFRADSTALWVPDSQVGIGKAATHSSNLCGSFWRHLHQSGCINNPTKRTWGKWCAVENERKQEIRSNLAIANLELTSDLFGLVYFLGEVTRVVGVNTDKCEPEWLFHCFLRHYTSLYLPDNVMWRPLLVT